MEFDYELHGGIETPIENLETSIWDRGYYCDTDEGVWYELYFNDEQKKHYPTELDLQQTLDENFKYGKNTVGFKGLLLFHFEDENQITFFVSHSEEEWTFDKMTDIFY
tara:strand:- start:166 stop:489 length:324 start_codon:yes stop_codon:yes gene_type:complete